MSSVRNVETLLSSACAEGFFQSAAPISHPATSKKQINMTLGIQNWLAIIKLKTMKHISINSSVIQL